MSTDPLAELRRAAAARRRAESTYRAALLDAYAALTSDGASDPFAQLAGALGISRQGARNAVERAQRAE